MRRSGPLGEPAEGSAGPGSAEREPRRTLARRSSRLLALFPGVGTTAESEALPSRESTSFCVSQYLCLKERAEPPGLGADPRADSSQEAGPFWTWCAFPGPGLREVVRAQARAPAREATDRAAPTSCPLPFRLSSERKGPVAWISHIYHSRSLLRTRHCPVLFTK